MANSRGCIRWQMHHGGRNADSVTSRSHNSSHRVIRQKEPDIRNFTPPLPWDYSQQTHLIVICYEFDIPPSYTQTHTFLGSSFFVDF